MEFLINNSSDIQNLKEVFENKNELQSTPFFETVSPQENEKLSMECLDEEEISYQTKSTEMDDDYIPDSFSKYLVDTSLIPKEVFEKKLFHEILKKKDKDNLLLYYCLGKKDEPSPELKEFFELIEKKVYFYFYKLFQSEEWEELLYEKIIENINSKKLFLHLFFRKGMIKDNLEDNDIESSFIELVHSIFDEINF